MMVSPAASRPVSSAIAASVASPAGSMIQTARGAVSLAHKIGDAVGRRGALARELTPRLGVPVVDHAAVAMTHEAAGNVRPHAPEADDADLHGRFLRSGPQFYSSAARRYYVSIGGGGVNL